MTLTMEKSDSNRCMRYLNLVVCTSCIASPLNVSRFFSRKPTATKAFLLSQCNMPCGCGADTVQIALLCESKVSPHKLIATDVSV